MLEGLVQDRNAWLVAVFGLYILSLFIFAALYERIYLKNPMSFSFNTDVSRSQDESYRAGKAKEAAALDPVIDTLVIAERELNEGRAEFLRKWYSNRVRIRSQSGYEVQLSSQSAGAGHGPAAYWKELAVYDPKGEALLLDMSLGDKYTLPETADEFRSTIGAIIADFRKSVTEGLEVATSPSSLPKMWSYWDFLYFSTITQSTVGYGDILPNSTIVRMVVVAQILVGYALLIVIINLVLEAKP